MALKCEACSLCRQPNIGTVRISGTGNSTSPIMVVLGRSTREDDRSGRAFQGTANQFFKNILKSAAINPDNCYFTNTVKCVQFGEDKEVAKESFQACTKTWLKREIDLIKPKVILALGNDAYEALTGNQSVIKDRGSLHTYSGEGYSSYVLPTYSPYYMAQAPNNSHLVSQCVTDLRKVNSIIMGKFGFWSDDMLDNGTLDYSVIDSLTKLQEVVQKAYKSGVLACDIEARKADPYRVDSTCVGPGYPLVSIQFATNEAEAFFLPWANVDFQTEDNPEGFAFSEEDRKLFIEELRPLLEDPDDRVTLIGHNFKFDAKWINKYLGIKCKLDYDTMLASSFMGEASNRLKKLAWSYTSIGGYENAQDEYTKGLPGPDQWDMFKYPLSVIIPYGCADADATLRIYHRFVADGVVNKRNAFVFESIITASNAFTDIENEGIHVDRPYLSQLDMDLELEMRKFEEEFRMMAHAEIEELNAEIYKESLGKKGLPLKHKNTGFIISSNDHISRLFYDKMKMPIDDKHRSKKTKDASTGVKALQLLVPNYPIARKLLDWRKVSKQKSGFVDAYPEFLDSNDRIHPDFKLVKYEDSDSGDLTGAITGRLSCSDPNLQNVPARGEGVRIKRLFIPDYKDEHLLVDFDFAGVELRVAAMYCQDPKMIAYFNGDQADFHAYAASQIYGCSVDQVTKAQRTLAKTFNFCILYGGSAAKVAELTGVCVEEAEKFIEDYFKVFPGLAQWIKGQHRFVKQNGYVTSMFGRVRHLADAMIVPKTREENNRHEAALRRAVNSPVQGDASDLTLLSLGRIWKYLSAFPHSDPSKPSRLRGSVHDSILLSVHVDDAGEIIPHIKFNILENPGVDFITSKGVSLRADVSAGPSWGDQTQLTF